MNTQTATRTAIQSQTERRAAKIARLTAAAAVLGCTFMTGEHVVTWIENGELKARGGMTGKGARELVNYQRRSCPQVTGSHADKVW
jgi:hypothetical protein